MLNGVDINYLIVLLVTGAVLLAALYHTVLFGHRRLALLGTYSAYLWATFCYCAFRAIRFSGDIPLYLGFNMDEVYQMIAFGFYIRFMSFALGFKRKTEPLAWRFSYAAPVVIGVYLAINTVLINAYGSESLPYFIIKMIVRLYLLLMGVLVLATVIPKRQSVYYRYLAAGSGSLIFFGLVSTVLSLFVPFDELSVAPLSWLMFGFFSDVVFFSSAIGYRLRQDSLEREEGLKALLQKEAQLQQKDLEKLKAVYETREEERLRIARDLHDDMGTTLSSIGIYGKVVDSYLQTHPQKARDYLRKMVEAAGQLMEVTTDLIWSLQTANGNSESVYTRMSKTAVEMLSSSNLLPHINLPTTSHLPQLTPAAQKAVWLIFKEAVTNACKYSKGANCWVSVQLTDGALELTVKDDGTGFGNPQRGNGLQNMRARAAELGGELTVKNGEDGGTSVAARFPVSAVTAARFE